MPPADERHAVAEAAQPLPRPLERLRIAIDADQPDLGVALQQPFRMSAETESRIDDGSVVTARGEELENFVEKNRLVNHG